MDCIQSEDAWALDRGTNSRRPLDILQYVSALCDSVTLTFDLFNLILIGGRGLMVDYPCDKFGYCTFSRFGFIVRTNTQTHTDAAKRFTHATVVGVSKKIYMESENTQTLKYVSQSKR